MKSIVAWSRVFAGQEIICAINTDIEQPTEVFVTVDTDLHADGDILKCIYQSPVPRNEPGPSNVTVVNANGKSVQITVPPSGFAMYL